MDVLPLGLVEAAPDVGLLLGEDGHLGKAHNVLFHLVLDFVVVDLVVVEDHSVCLEDADDAVDHALIGGAQHPLRLFQHYFQQEVVLEQGLGLVEAQGQEGEPVVEGLRDVEFIRMSLDDLADG